MSAHASTVCGFSSVALLAALAVGCGDDTGSPQGGNTQGGAAQGGADQGGAGGGDDACADAGGGEAPAGATASEVACTDVCNRYAQVTCQLSCSETLNCVDTCLAYVDQVGPTAECEEARLALFQCIAEESDAQTCSCSGGGGALACQVCATEKGALEFCE